MSKTDSYECECGWSRIVLDGQTVEDAKRIHEGTAIHRIAMAELRPVHTVNGKGPGPEGWAYGQTHDMDCPGCQGTSFTASPRSETYWSS